ncbi:2-keto-4-pentenoate hydratase [Pseudomonas inefficax]|jgi:2-keto-4-pentenoate hydratase|uniref:2-keto-4-pentenoate hydratase n=1 Tax=Pseudomonas inefficax TaxID=2078786 RepID=UPI0028BD5DE6|nr:2-keto-4-pentenoate hydratase [Pseudomonas inefficax]WNN40200.1 2-keto-4-pentenoate hydratase [Pseudomonas inefficax]
MELPQHISSFAKTIVEADKSHSQIYELHASLVPADVKEAYQTQQEILRLRRVSAAGWKVGARSPSASIQGSPLPHDRIYPSASRLATSEFPFIGVELEIAFRLKESFAPRHEPYSDAEVLSAIGEMGATIEIVSSRFANWPEAPALAKLADLMNHGALVTGQFVPYSGDFDFINPPLKFSFNGASISSTTGKNPAGDPRRLLTWLVNHHIAQGVTLPQDLVVTTGSYTGLHMVTEAGSLVGEIMGLPALSVSFS